MLKHPIFAYYQQYFELLQYQDHLSIDQINDLYQDSLQKYHSADDQSFQELRQFRFQDQAILDTNIYYEDRVFAQKIIPTRLNNPHDLFGALIWALFPKTKQLLNQLHQQEIQNHGLKQRTRLRDQLTLFDESGVILFYRDQRLIQPILAYDWQSFFYDQRASWINGDLRCVVFGHAILEQFINPHPNITGKTIFLPLAQYTPEDLSLMDQNLYTIFQSSTFASLKFHPLPLIGIPGFTDGQNADFYLNPKCFKKPISS